jgi:hypothetical protein
MQAARPSDSALEFSGQRQVTVADQQEGWRADDRGLELARPLNARFHGLSERDVDHARVSGGWGTGADMCVCVSNRKDGG